MDLEADERLDDCLPVVTFAALDHVTKQVFAQSPPPTAVPAPALTSPAVVVRSNFRSRALFETLVSPDTAVKHDIGWSFACTFWPFGAVGCDTHSNSSHRHARRPHCDLVSADFTRVSFAELLGLSANALSQTTRELENRAFKLQQEEGGPFTTVLSVYILHDGMFT